MSKHPPRPLPEDLHLPFTGVDSHAHLDSRGLMERLPEVLLRAARSGVARIGQVFLGPEAYATHKPLLDEALAAARRAGPVPELFCIMGVHPCDAAACTGQTFAAMRAAFAADPSLRAVGETGLDFYWKDCPPFIQEQAFRLHLALAKALTLPVVIHSRDAADATLRILEAEGFAGYPVLWHCFGGDAVARLDRLLANGWHISLPGPATYPANKDLREAAAAAPLERLLLETDCPYLSPQPWRGKPNEPALAVFTAEAVAQARGMDPAELWTACGMNAAAFFGLAPLSAQG